MKVTKAHARKVLAVVDAGLVSGLGEPEPGKMCVEAAVCFALGLPHSDDPPCVDNDLRLLKINLNDCPWSSNEARAKGMRKLAILQLGTNDVLDKSEFTRRVAELTVRSIAPVALRAAAARPTTTPRRAKLLYDAATRCEQEGSKDAAAHACAAMTPDNLGRYISAAKATIAAYRATATHGDEYEADAFHGAEAARAVAFCCWPAQRMDKVLQTFAEGVEKILIDMKVPAAKWLDLISDHPAPFLPGPPQNFS